MDKVAELYKPNYWNDYGSDVAITVIIISCVAYWSGKSTMDSALKTIRMDWNNKRCNPLLIPFAGLIVPKEGESTFGTTADNFEYCIQMDASHVMEIAMMPLEITLFTMIKGMDMFIMSMMNFMEFTAWMRNQLGGYMATVYNQILLVIIPIITFVIKIRDSLGKMNGIITVMLYTILDMYNIMVSGVLNVGNIILGLLIALIASMVALVISAYVLMSIPFTIPIGMTLLFVAVGIITITIIPIIILYVMMDNFNKQVLSVSSGSSPNPPSTGRPRKRRR